MNKLQYSRDSNLLRLWRFLSARLEIFAAALAGLLTGLLLLVLGPTLTAAILLGIVAVFVLFKLPELAILLLLLLTSGLLPAQYNPSINLFIGHFQISDLILIALLAVTVLRLLAERKFKLRPTPLYLPLVLFCLAIVGGMLTAVLQHGIPFSHTTYEARILLYYSLFFATINLIRSPLQIRRLIYGIFLIGILVAILVIGQVVLGQTLSITLPAYFKPDLLVRPYHPGFIAIYMTMIVFICLLANKLRLPWAMTTWAIALLLGLANTISLGRNIIISSLLALAMLFVLLSSPQRKIWLQNMLVLFVLAIGSFAILQILVPTTAVLEYPGALAQRFYHFFATDPLSPDETLLWRIQEADYAWEQILQNPVTGIGLSVNYRPALTETDTMQRFIHNGYLWVWLKTGLIGLLAFIWFLLAFLVNGFRCWAQIHDTVMRSTAIGCALVVFAMLFSDFVAPLLVENFNLVFFAVGMGVVEAIFASEKEIETSLHLCPHEADQVPSLK